jgi:cyclopropane fatty-acyl-phospholipid synthase-like methyltransferase
MSEVSFEVFGDLGASDLSDTEKVGRHALQEEDERNIVADIVDKLALGPGDDLLEIGCGTGTLLIPLSFMVASATGNDHENMTQALEKRFSDKRLKGIPGNFFDIELEGDFSKVLIYSVIHYLKDAAEVIAFIEKASRLLRPQGRLLVGDLPNDDCKQRFSESERGKRFNEEWVKKVAANETSKGASEHFARIGKDEKRVPINDDLVVQIVTHFRKLGFDVFILPQERQLPMCHTREDILIVRN